MTDTEWSIRFEQLDPARDRRCSCTTYWQHTYFHCSGIFFPDFDTESFQCYGVLERGQRLATAFRDHSEIFCSLGHDTYHDLYEALHQDKDTFVNFLGQEPNRLEHYWRTDLAEGINAHITSLATTILAFSNYGRIIVGRLLRPDAFYQVFGHSITPWESNIMLRSKQKFNELWNSCVRHVGYGDCFPPYTNITDNPSVIMPERPTYRYVWDDSATAIINEVQDDGGGPQEDRQERFDSGAGLDEKGMDDAAAGFANVRNDSIPNGQRQEGQDFILDNTGEELKDVPVMNGHAQEDMEETFADVPELETLEQVPVVNENQHEDQGNGILDESLEASIVETEHTPTTNEHSHDDEENNSTPSEDDVSCNAPPETVLAVNRHPHDDSHPTSDDNQRISSPPIDNIGDADEQAVNPLEALSDDTYEISEQHPEIVAALQMIVALGNSIRTQNSQRANGDS